MSQLTFAMDYAAAAPRGWHAVEWRRQPRGRVGRARACAWRSDLHPFFQIRHCGHPTALRPYYILTDDGEEPTPRKFSRLKEAMDAVKALARGEEVS